jgi:hypothetical protein
MTWEKLTLARVGEGKATHEEAETLIIFLALRRYGGHRSYTAYRLRISERMLRQKINDREPLKEWRVGGKECGKEKRAKGARDGNGRFVSELPSER